jgi:hypothetical protein
MPDVSDELGPEGPDWMECYVYEECSKGTTHDLLLRGFAVASDMALRVGLWWVDPTIRRTDRPRFCTSVPVARYRRTVMSGARLAIATHKYYTVGVLYVGVGGAWVGLKPHEFNHAFVAAWRAAHEGRSAL